MNNPTASAPWPLPARIGFRFAALYFPAYLVVALTHVNGPSSDTSAVFHLLSIVLPAAIAGTLLWSWLDRRATSYPRLYPVLDGFLRFIVIAAMMLYGFDKLFLHQFPKPDAAVLQAPLGKLGPMRFMWLFMGYSPLYQAFGGAAELAGALLLSFRRTRLLGALLLIGVMTNVFLLNLSYDVCVKLLSGHLLLMVLFLTAPDLPRLRRFFLAAPAPVVRGPVLRWTRRVAAAVLVLLFALMGGRNVIGLWKEAHLRGPLGTFEVVRHTRDGEVPQPATERWRAVTLAGSYFQFTPEEGDLHYFHLTRTPQSATSGTLSILDDEDPARPTIALAYSITQGGAISLEGRWHGHLIHDDLRPVDLNAYPLAQHSFHWVQ